MGESKKQSQTKPKRKQDVEKVGKGEGGEKAQIKDDKNMSLRLSQDIAFDIVMNINAHTLAARKGGVAKWILHWAQNITRIGQQKALLLTCQHPEKYRTNNSFQVFQKSLKKLFNYNISLSQRLNHSKYLSFLIAF